MKKLSETLKELGIAFTFPINIKDADGNVTYFESRGGFWHKKEYDSNGKETYFEDSHGNKRGIPRSQFCEGKVVEIDGIKYELKLKN